MSPLIPSVLGLAVLVLAALLHRRTIGYANCSK